MAQPFHIGTFLISPDLNRIEDSNSAEASVQVEPKIMDVLVCLQDAAGAVVSREQILASVWGDTIVGDDVLTRAVGQLRKILGDDPRQPRFIETIPRRGYRLLAVEIGLADSPTAPLATESSTPKTARRGGFRQLHAVVVLVVVGAVSVALFQQKFAVADRVVVPTRVFPITSFAGKEVDPAVSPDGRQVAYVARLADSEQVNIHIHDLETGLTRQLTFDDTHNHYPNWSPDGLSIAYVGQGVNCGLWVVPAEGGIPRAVVPCDQLDEEAISWTHDSKSLVYVWQDKPGAPSKLYMVNLASGDTRTLTAPNEDHAGDYDPAVSPVDGTVAFKRVRAGGAQDIYTVPQAGGEPRRLTFDSQVLTGLDWSEDGRHIIYSSQRAGLFSLWRVSAEGGLPQLVLGGGDKIKDPSTADQVSMVAFENWVYETNIWRLPLTEGESEHQARPERLVHSTQWDLQPAYAPDGRSLAFVSTRSGGGQIWLADADGSNPRRLTNFTTSRVGSPSWSPDGTRLAFTVLVGGQSDIYVMPVEGGKGFSVTSDPLDDMHPSWTNDGHGIYFASRRSGTWQVWQVDLEDGRKHQITADGGLVAHETWDGQLLYFTKPDQDGLWERPISGGQARRIIPNLTLFDAGNWAVAREGIFYVDQDSLHERGFSHWERRTGLTTRLIDADSLSGQGLSVSPDGRWLAFSRFDRAECDILAAEGLR